jgi:pyruvate dehydrogenase phosphatase
MKYKDFSTIPSNLNGKYIGRVINNFNGPYIDNQTEIIKIDLTPEDEFIIIGSDGLWDLVNADEICDIIKRNKNKTNIIRYLTYLSLKKASKLNNIAVDELLKKPPGTEKRKFHDDVTIMVVDLKNQVNKKI